MNGNDLDLIWGIEAIAKAIGRTERQTYDMLSSGHLPARQVGTRWVAHRSKLLAFFMGESDGDQKGEAA